MVIEKDVLYDDEIIKLILKSKRTLLLNKIFNSI